MHRLRFFRSKSFENTHDGWMMNDIFSFKIHFWYMRISKGSQVGFGTYFGGNKLRFLHISTNSNFISWKSHQLALEGYSALHKDSTRSKDHEMWDWPHFEDHSLSCKIVLTFYFRHIWSINSGSRYCVVKAINMKTEDEHKIRFWVLYSTVLYERLFP